MKYPTIVRADGQRQLHPVWDVVTKDNQVYGTVCLRIKHITVKRVGQHTYEEVQVVDTSLAR